LNDAVPPSTGPADESRALRGVDPLRLRRWMLLLVALIALVIGGIFINAVNTAARRNEAAAIRQGVTLTRVIVEQAGRILGAADRTLASLAQRVGDGAPGAEGRLVDAFADRRDLVPGAIAAFALGPAGEVRVETGEGSAFAEDPSVAEFLANLTDASAEITQISRPFRDRAGGRWLLLAARTVATTDGAYGGAVGLAIEIDALRAFHATIDVGRNGTIALWRDDGVLLSREPVDTGQLGRRFEGPLLDALRAGRMGGIMLVDSPLDGIERRLTWQRLPGLPVAASVALSTADYRESLRESVAQQSVAAGTGAVLVLALAALVWMQLGRFARLEAAQREDREQALRVSRQLRAVIDAVPAIINAKDEHGRYTLMNAFQARVFGIRPADAIGKRLADFTDPEFAREVEVRERVAMRARVASHDVEDSFTIDGIHRSFLAAKVPIVDPDGVARQIVSVATDVSALKTIEAKARAAEARLRAALDAIPEGFAIYDEEDRLAIANRPYAEMFTDHGDPARIRGLSFEAMVRSSIARGEPPEPGYDVESWVAERLRRHREGGHKPRLLKIGGERWISVAEQHVPGVGTVGVRTDVTKLIATEAELRLTRDQAEAANRAKSLFLANMSHELRTPLNAIIGFSEIIENQIFGPAGSPRYVEYARDIASSGRHLVALIGDVLDMSKIEAGRMELEETEVAVADVVEGALALVRGEAATRGVRLTADAPALPLALRADARALRQVLLNLLSNAIKFTPQGGRVELRVRAEPAGLEIAVADTGVGIAPEDLPHVTEPFRQAVGTSTRFGGTGLGLSISKHLVEMHQGLLELESTQGKGTVARVWLPAARVVARDAA
jgi:PAS domain S-box-containing protein